MKEKTVILERTVDVDPKDKHEVEKFLKSVDNLIFRYPSANIHVSITMEDYIVMEDANVSKHFDGTYILYHALVLHPPSKSVVCTIKVIT